MDLFHMRRYQSDDEVENDEESNEKAILEKLKAKSKKRKLDDVKAEDKSAKVEEDKENDEAQEVDTSVDKPAKKKKKNKKKKKSAGDKAAEGFADFTPLGVDLNQGKNKVKRVLPEWLTKPEVIDTDFDKSKLTPVNEFADLNPLLKAKLSSEGVTHFFPVQKTVIPFLLPKRSHAFFPPNDVCVSAPTGSGKTLAFVLPILHALADRVTPAVRALVILPVQDLATQVFKVFQTYAEGLGKNHIPLKVKLLSPKNSFESEQKDLVKQDILGARHNMVDVIVATPGRLVDHLAMTAGFSLRDLRYLVIDEADRVMADLQNNWLEEVEKAVFAGGRVQHKIVTNSTLANWGEPLQKLLFSATLSQNPEQLERLNFFQPRLFTSVVSSLEDGDEKGDKDDFEFIGQYTTPAELTERLILVEDSLKKPQILHHIVKDMKRVLVFTNTLEHTHNLFVLLQSYGLSVGELSSQVSNLITHHFRISFLFHFPYLATRLIFMAGDFDFRKIILIPMLNFCH